MMTNNLKNQEPQLNEDFVDTITERSIHMEQSIMDNFFGNESLPMSMASLGEKMDEAFSHACFNACLALYCVRHNLSEDFYIQAHSYSHEKLGASDEA